MASDLSREIEPTPVRMEAPSAAQGHWLLRTVRAVLLERRLPTRAAETRDQLLRVFGFPEYSTSVDDAEASAAPARFRVRRGTADVFYLQEVFRECAYTRNGYEISPSDRVIDVGGNIGAFAVYAGRRAREGRVISFEPLSENHALLLKNVQQNRLANVTVVHGAIAGANADVTLYRSDDGTGNHSLVAALAGATSRSEQIAASTIEKVLQRFNLPKCDFLKLDCEGAEFEIIASLTQDVARTIRRIVLEYHAKPDSPKRTQADTLIERLVTLGYVIDRYEDHLETNRGMIFARRDDASLSQS